MGAALEERCIANHVASLHNQHLGKQQIRRSTEWGAGETRAKCYIHISIGLRQAGGGKAWKGNAADPFDAASLHLQVRLSMKVWRGAESCLQSNFCNVDLKESGQKKKKKKLAGTWEALRFN